MHKIKLEIRSKYNETIYNALRYEEAPKVNVKCYLKNKKLFFEIEANSISNLRAACNAFIKWIDMIERIINEIKENKKYNG